MVLCTNRLNSNWTLRAVLSKKKLLYQLSDIIPEK